MSDQVGNELLGPLAVPHSPVRDLDSLRTAVQRAIQVEFTTVPPYLFALYSIKDRTSEAYQALRSVVVEEMFHVNQAANLLVAIGGKPKMTGSAVPTYPTHLPSGSRTRMPYVGLYCASASAFREVFMAIEMPAPFSAPAQGENYSTIGQFYKALEEGLEYCVSTYGENEVFSPSPDARQRTDIYLGKFGGRAIKVHNLASATDAIRQIRQQGEGVVGPTEVLVPEQPWGAYNHYGMRVDGTYGPILGTPYELSHYFKFKRIVESRPFPETYPVMSNPQMRAFSNPVARERVHTFNTYYSVMLHSLEKAFEAGPGDNEIYFKITLPMMHSHMPQVAQVLVTTPVTPDGDSSVGPNAGATFEYDPRARLTDLVGEIEALRDRAPSTGFLPMAAFPAVPPAHTGPTVTALTTTQQRETLDRLLVDVHRLLEVSEREE